MPHLPSASLCPSLLALAIFSALPGIAFAATDDITVTATGNARSAFEAPMMVSVIDASAPEKQTASSAADLLRNVPGLTLDGTGRTNGQDVNLRGYDRRGVLVLGQDAPLDELTAKVALAARQPLCRGFAVGRTIFAHAAERWLSGEFDDEAAIADMARRFGTLVAAWRAARAGVPESEVA